jgi:hypothetical protein
VEEPERIFVRTEGFGPQATGFAKGVDGVNTLPPYRRPDRQTSLLVKSGITGEGFARYRVMIPPTRVPGLTDPSLGREISCRKAH